MTKIDKRCECVYNNITVFLLKEYTAMIFITLLRHALSFLSDTIYPPVCCICKDISRGTPSEKQSKINLGGKVFSVGLCPDCAASIERSYGPWKRRTSIRNNTAFYLFNYRDEAVRKLMHHVKTCKCRSCRKFFAKALEECLDVMLSDGSELTYIPRSQTLMKKYGFDQSKCVAEEYVRLHPETKFRQLFIRNEGMFRNTPQKRLNRKQRLENAGRSLSLVGNTHFPHNVVLFDDIITTGATADAASALLEKENVQNVKLLFLASANLVN